MRILISIIAIVIFGATAVQLYQLQLKKAELKSGFEKAEKKVNALALENKALKEEIKYFGDSKNLEKEAKAQLNYASPGEKLIIVVPKKS